MSEMFAHLGLGFGVALTLQNVALCFVGCLVGTLVGVLPGVGPIATIAMTIGCALMFKYALGLPIPLAPWLLGI